VFAFISRSVLRELKLRCASSVCADSGSSRASYEPLSQGPLPEPALRTSSADSHTESVSVSLVLTLFRLSVYTQWIYFHCLYKWGS